MAKESLEAFFNGRGGGLAHFRTAAQNVEGLLTVAEVMLGARPGPSNSVPKSDVIAVAGLLLQYEALLLAHPKK